MMTNPTPKMARLARRLIREGFRRFPDNPAMAEAWATEQLQQQMDQLLTTDVKANLPFVAEHIVRVAKDAAEIHPHDEEAAMEWMRETAKAQGLPDMSPVIEELHRQRRAATD
jgi:hypothetical protein